MSNANEYLVKGFETAPKEDLINRELDSEQISLEYREKLLEDLKNSNKQYDIETIEKAFYFADNAHKGVTRKSGAPYITHPVNVAIYLIELGMDSDSIVAALLHDVVEDTDYTIDDIKKEFGPDVALLVDGVTKLGKIPYTSRERQQAENIRKMLLAMAHDVRVIVIKLADRLHNMRTIEFMPEDKKMSIALETMEVYAPLAHRLGISGVKEELEDISIKYLDPVAYEEIDKMMKLRKDEREVFLNHIKEIIEQRLAEEKVTAHIDGRVKSFYGIYRKVYVQGRSMDEIYDIYAVRIIVDSVHDCYNVLGIIHDMLRPIPNRFKDYISTPKQNMYQSLHTTVIGKDGIPFEVQIRTWDMHYTAEYGVAAHWKYKIGMESKDSLDERLSWIRKLLESQKENDDAEELVKSIKTDIAPEEVFIFTPNGDVISLPAESTVIDFAYAIHSEVGNKMVGAKVDGKIVPLDFKVRTGMIVEVMTSSAKDSGPSRDWLNIVRTSEARNKIRSWFKKERREENIIEGKNALDKEFRRNFINLPENEKDSFILELANRQKYSTVDDFYAAIGYGGITLQKIMPRVKDDFISKYRTLQPTEIINANIPKKMLNEKTSTPSSVIVEGLDGCLVRFAGCCKPVPGERIVGFITRGYGVSVHREDCLNVIKSKENKSDRERWIKVSWANNVRESFKATLEVCCEDRNSLLADISTTIGNMRIPIHSIFAHDNNEGKSILQITVGVRDLDELTNVINNIARVQSVLTVRKANTQ